MLEPTYTELKHLASHRCHSLVVYCDEHAWNKALLYNSHTLTVLLQTTDQHLMTYTHGQLQSNLQLRPFLPHTLLPPQPARPDMWFTMARGLSASSVADSPSPAGTGECSLCTFLPGSASYIEVDLLKLGCQKARLKKTRTPLRFCHVAFSSCLLCCTLAKTSCNQHRPDSHSAQSPVAKRSWWISQVHQCSCTLANASTSVLGAKLCLTRGSASHSRASESEAVL